MKGFFLDISIKLISLYTIIICLKLNNYQEKKFKKQLKIFLTFDFGKIPSIVNKAPI